MAEASFPAEPVLIVDDEPEIVSSAEIALALAGITNVATCTDSTAVSDLVSTNSYSAVTLDLLMPRVSGEQLLPVIQEGQPDTPIVVVTSKNDVETAVELMKDGAFDYLVKPVDTQRLVATVRHAIEYHEMRKVNSSLREHMLNGELDNPDAYAHILTANSRMQSIFRYVDAIAPTSLPVLITGETGVGKELLAEAVHKASGRTGEFVVVNTAGLDDQLFSDTLFGHVKGAFTGSVADRRGMIARAAGGTLFLDEIGDLPPESQVKLLRLTQQREYYPLGSDSVQHTDARFVFATNRNLGALVQQRAFRQDLYYRLRSHKVEIPPLRERPDDILLLAEHFLDEAARETDRPRPSTPPAFATYLKMHDYPGNVRELQGMIFDAVIRHTSGVLSLDHFGEIIGEPHEHSAATERGPHDLQSASVDELFTRLPRLPHLQQAVDALIQEALKRADGNQTAAARLLGMTRSALNKRLNR
jgi:DNA-binding NtrC family response regulator